MEGNPFDRLETETARVDHFLSDLDTSGWRVPTRCEGWNRADLLAHLCGIEEYIAAGLDDRVAEYAEQAGQGVGYERFNDIMVARRGGTEPSRLLAEWRRRVTDTRPRLRARGADALIATHAGPYSCGRQSWYFATEYAIHADDMAAPVPPHQTQERLEWRLEFALDAMQEVAPQVTVSRESDGYLVSAGDQSYTLSAVDLVEAASGRLTAGAVPRELREALVVLA